MCRGADQLLLPRGRIGGEMTGPDRHRHPSRDGLGNDHVPRFAERLEREAAELHGVPVIATKTGTFAQQITDGVDGLLCDPGDVASLAQALTRFGAPGEAERLRAGVRPVDSEPLWDSYLKTLLALASPGS